MSNTELENKNQHLDQDDNEEQVNELLANKIQDIDLNKNVLLEEDGTKSKKKKGKQPKEKNAKKGEDFMEYAKKNEIEVNLKYEEKDEKKRDFNVGGKDYSQGNYNNKNNNYDKNSNNYENNYSKDEKNYNKNYNNYNNKNYNKNYNNNYNNYNNKNYNSKYKKGYYNKNYNNQYNHNQNNNKAFNNKFDPINGHSNHPYVVYPVNNQMMRPDMMYYGQMPMNGNQFPQQVFPPQQDDIHNQNLSEKGIKESLEYYLSLDNLNKDLFIRKLIDQNGYIAVEEILKFNNMTKNNATNDTILQLVSESKIIEQEVVGEKVCLRNKLWNDLKHNLVSLEELEAKKNHKKGNYNYNYVTMQNNYFMPMVPMDNQMMMQGGIPNMNQFMPHPNMMGNMGQQFKGQNQN